MKVHRMNSSAFPASSTGTTILLVKVVAESAVLPHTQKVEPQHALVSAATVTSLRAQVPACVVSDLNQLIMAPILTQRRIVRQLLTHHALRKNKLPLPAPAWTRLPKTRSASSNALLISKMVSLQLVAALWLKELVSANAVLSPMLMKIAVLHVRRQDLSLASMLRVR